MLDNRKTIISIAVVILFFGLALSPAIGADAPETKTKKMTVLMKGVTDNNYLVEIKVTEEDLIKFNNEMDNFLEIVNKTRSENSDEGVNISYCEWDLLNNAINKIIDLIADFIGDDFPKEEVKNFVLSLIKRLISPVFLFKQPLISIGIGITFIPFYDFESFFGKMIRPVFIQYLFGFSATSRLIPFIIGFPTVRFGLHRIRTFLFDGLMINFADLGVNSIIGPQLLLGFGCFTGFA